MLFFSFFLGLVLENIWFFSKLSFEIFQFSFFKVLEVWVGVLIYFFFIRGCVGFCLF